MAEVHTPELWCCCRNNEIKFTGVYGEQGIKYTLQVPKGRTDVLSRQVRVCVIRKWEQIASFVGSHGEYPARGPSDLTEVAQQKDFRCNNNKTANISDHAGCEI